jgi:hypothetical protein
VSEQRANTKAKVAAFAEATRQRKRRRRGKNEAVQKWKSKEVDHNLPASFFARLPSPLNYDVTSRRDNKDRRTGLRVPFKLIRCLRNRGRI